MKKFLKNNIFGLILGIILGSGIVYAANVYKAIDISYEPTDASWEVNNVEAALNDLYKNSNTVKSIEFSLGQATNNGGATGYRGSMRFDTKWFQENVESLWVRNCASSNTDVGIFYNNSSTTAYASFVSGGAITNTTSDYQKITMSAADSDTYKYTWVVAFTGNNEYMAAAEIKLVLK